MKPKTKEINLSKIKEMLKKHKEELRQKYGVNKIGIFGSYARGEQKKTSDVDVLVKFRPNATLFDLVGAGNFLEEKLKIKVDIVSEGGIRQELKDTILKEVI